MKVFSLAPTDWQFCGAIFLDADGQQVLKICWFIRILLLHLSNCYVLSRHFHGSSFTLFNTLVTDVYTIVLLLQRHVIHLLLMYIPLHCYYKDISYTCFWCIYHSIVTTKTHHTLVTDVYTIVLLLQRHIIICILYIESEWVSLISTDYPVQISLFS